MLWNKCLLAASLLSCALAVPLKIRAASAEEVIPNMAIGNYDEKDAGAVGEDEGNFISKRVCLGNDDKGDAKPVAKDEEFISNRAIGCYDNDKKRNAKPVAEDEVESIPNEVIGKYDERDANSAD